MIVGNIHLILPLPFEKTVRGTLQHEILSNLSKVRSLAVYDPYKLAKEKYNSTDTENIAKVIDEQTAHLLQRFNCMNMKMQYQEDNTKYFYDCKRDSYVDTESLYVLDDYEITHTLGLMYDPYILDKEKQENDYFIESIQKPVPRPDGKRICEKLREVRKEFARINGITYTFRDCKYNGPCAGTCQACDKEAEELLKLAKENGTVKYPEIKLEESV